VSLHAAILLPGPSLAQLEIVPRGVDVVIGVKRAAVRFVCDWAVVLDIPDLITYADRLIARPHLLTRAKYRPKYTSLPGTNFEELGDYCPVLLVENGSWASAASLALAGYLGAKRIDAYGADFNSDREWDGHQSAEPNYTSERWARELKQWNAVADWLAGRGVEVSRCQPLLTKP
jgi:hypothetical protein